MEFKPNFEELQPYYEAFWNCEVLDKIAVIVKAPKRKGSDISWFNRFTPYFLVTQKPDIILDAFEEYLKEVYYGGLAVPYFLPFLGPDILSAFLGAEIQFSPESKETSWIDWSKPLLPDYKNLEQLYIDESNPLYQKYLNLTKAAAERGKNRYIVGVTDLHSNFDALCVLRGGPDRACMDLIDYPEEAKKVINFLYKAWQKVYDDYWSIVKDIQKGSTTWIDIWAPGKMFPVQNDFSCLVSSSVYKEFFLEELLWEIEYLDYSIYHLDGVEALQHLDILLDIPKLNAIQWVSGAKFSSVSIERWIPLYQKIQAKKKAIIVYPKLHEIDIVLENLRPEGLLLSLSCSCQEEAKEVLKKLGWKND
ncbi:MAG: hypothetical protein N3D17_05075 [bacterium]|nr:hypothetical protein [bacterium]